MRKINAVRSSGNQLQLRLTCAFFKQTILLAVYTALVLTGLVAPANATLLPPPVDAPISIAPPSPPPGDDPPPPDQPPQPDQPPPVPIPLTIRKAMTWTVLGQQGANIHVGSDAQTNAYSGDTAIDTYLPILCVMVDGRAAPNGISFDFYNGWVKGAVQTTPPIPGTVLTSSQQGDEICAETFGVNWRLAEFHDAFGGWSYWATTGQQMTLSPGTRFWASINDQPANPWNAVGEIPVVAPPKFFPSEAPVPNQYIAMFSEGTPAENVSTLASNLLAQYGGTVIDLFPDVGGFSFTGTEAGALAMSQSPLVESVEQDTNGEPMSTWHQDRIDQHFQPLDYLPYNPKNNGAGVNIYILDSGFRRSHQEFGGRARQDADFIRFLGSKDDCNGHGTAVGSVAGGNTVGVAPGANLISIRISGCKGYAWNPIPYVFSSTVVAGLNWVAHNRIKPAVANVSYGFPPGFWRRWLNLPTPMDRAVNLAVTRDVTVTVAAGNENKNANKSTPARAAKAISVSSTNIIDQRRASANYGKVELFAPGENIQVAKFDSDIAMGYDNGTSLSAPMVAGAAAIYLHDHPTASPWEVRNHLLGTATPNVVTDTKGSNNLLLYVPRFIPHAGMTWTVLQQLPNNIVHVGSDNVTNAYAGDTPGTASLPILCASTSAASVPVPPGITTDFYNGWLRGQVAATPPVLGAQLTSRAAADALCVMNFGAGWKMAEFHDGWFNNAHGGWTFWAYGTIPINTRFWVAINDQLANPWN